ncbi:MAG: chitobiase/beta-hexosaminidase C-terminal domain-containing protein [Candidatus Sulfotelmatobacter sp.]
MRDNSGSQITSPPPTINSLPSSFTLTFLIILLFILGCLMPLAAHAQSVTFQGLITTVAGTGYAGFDGIATEPATSASLSRSFGVAMDGSGNIYFADSDDNLVRKINVATGVVTTVAGNGTCAIRDAFDFCFSGDGGPATSAELYFPGGVAVDGSGNLYIADEGNQRIRMVSAATGIITTVAGIGVNGGVGGYNGDNILATNAQLNDPQGLAVDGLGNLYIADSYNFRIRMVSKTTGLITSFAGTGTSGYNGDNIPANIAELGFPIGVAVDSAGDLYIADLGGRIRMVNATTAIITTVAGTSIQGYNGDNIAATTAELYGSWGVAVDGAGNLYIADSENGRIRMVNATTGLITTVAGTGQYGYNGDNIAATSAELNNPTGVAVDGAGNVYIADTNNYRIRKAQLLAVNLGTQNVGQSSVTSPFTFAFSASTQVGNISVLTLGASSLDFQAASGSNCTATTYSNASLCTVNLTFTPRAPGVRKGAVVLYDTSSPANVLAQVNVSGIGGGSAIGFGPGIITTVAGNGSCAITDANGRCYSGDGGSATSAEMGPAAVAMDALGNLFIADSANNRVREVNAATGLVSTVVGTGNNIYNGDNIAATTATVGYPSDVALDGAGNLYIADELNSRIRMVNLTTGIITTVAGNGSCAIQDSFGRCYSGDGGPAINAELNYANHIALDLSGNLYIADSYNERVRKVNLASGIITTAVGTGFTTSNGVGGYNGDNIPATSAVLNWPAGLAVDSAGNLYIADYGNSRIREVSAATGLITTVAGTNEGGYNGDNIPATSAWLYAPNDVAVDSAGDIYITDNDSLFRKVNAATGIINIVAGIGYSVNGYNGDNIVATSAELNYPVGVALDGSNNLYIADGMNGRIRRIDVSDAPSLTFASTKVGSASTAQDVIVENLGNTPLNITQISTAANFSLGGADTSCSTSAQLLGAAATCILGIEFAPTGSGSISGGVTLTDTAGTQTIQLNGTAISLTSIAITPAGANIPFPGTVLLTATGYYSDGSTQNLTTTAVWSSSNPAAAMVASGLVTAVAGGSTNITATSAGIISNSAPITVTPTLTSIAITPASATVLYAGTVQLTATGHYNDGSTQNLTSTASWTSSNPSAATVASGLVTGVGSGSANITASFSGIASNLSTITVSAQNPAAAPGFSPFPSNYTAPESVTLSDKNSGVTIYYTLDGSTPSATHGTPYTAAIKLAATTTINAIATGGSYGPSAVSSATYTLSAATPGFSPFPSNYTAPQTVTLSDSAPNASIYYTTDGSTPSATNGTLYSTAIKLTTSTTIKAIAIGTGLTSSAVATGTYTLQAMTPGFSPLPSSYHPPQTVTLSDSTAGATIQYTTDGSTPSATNGSTYSGPIPLTQVSTTIKAVALGTGLSSSAVATGTYTLQAMTPGFSPFPSTYTRAQTVTLSDSTSGATVYYTTDGSTPSATNGTRYAGPFTVATTTTIKAVAVGTAFYGSSAVATGTYTIP